MEDFINQLHELFLPICGPWLNKVIPIMGYINSVASFLYLYFGIKETIKPAFKDVFGTVVWVPVVAVVCLAGIYYKNAHQAISFFLAFIFLFMHSIVLIIRYTIRRKKIKIRL